MAVPCPESISRTRHATVSLLVSKRRANDMCDYLQRQIIQDMEFEHLNRCWLTVGHCQTLPLASGPG